MTSAPAPRPVLRPVLRPVADTEVAEVLALNEAEVVNLAPMDEVRFRELYSLADRFDVVEVDGAFAGFVVTFTSGVGYDSENYRWFSDQLEGPFYYLDRVVLVEQVRRRGVAGFVYDEIESVASAHGRLALEVNLVPENLASLAFHRGREYAEVGRLGDDQHLVSLMVKSLQRGR